MMQTETPAGWVKICKNTWRNKEKPEVIVGVEERTSFGKPREVVIRDDAKVTGLFLYEESINKAKRRLIKWMKANPTVTMPSEWLSKRLEKYSPRKLSPNAFAVDPCRIPWSDVLVDNKIDVSLCLHLVTEPADTQVARIIRALGNEEVAVVCNHKWDKVEIVSKKGIRSQAYIYYPGSDRQMSNVACICKILSELPQRLDVSNAPFIFIEFEEGKGPCKPEAGQTQSVNTTLAMGDRLMYLYKHAAKETVSKVCVWYEGDVLQYVPLKRAEDIPWAVEILIKENSIIEKVCAEIDQEIEREVMGRVRERIKRELAKTN